MATKTINILGDSQREQWHSVVNMLRVLGGDLTADGRSQICDEIDRYIDSAEDIFEKLNKRGYLDEVLDAVNNNKKDEKDGERNG